MTARHLSYRGARHARLRHNLDLLFDGSKISRGDSTTERAEALGKMSPGLLGKIIPIELRDFARDQERPFAPKGDPSRAQRKDGAPTKRDGRSMVNGEACAGLCA